MSQAKGSRQSVTVAAVQFASVPGDVRANLAKTERLGRSLKDAHPGIELLVYPELAITGYSIGHRFYEVAERWPDGAGLRRLSRLAADLEVVLIAGYAEADTSGVIYDSAAIFDRDGSPLASYRKTHCLDTERRYFANGSELPLVTTSVGRLGVMICWDAAFPEVARTHALAGADMFVTIGAWEDPHVQDWDLVVSARAYDNVTPSVAVNRTGADGDVRFSGHAGLVDCLGRPLVRLGETEDDVLIGTVDYAGSQIVRAGYGSQIRDRRPELYAAVSAPVGAPAETSSPERK